MLDCISGQSYKAPVIVSRVVNINLQVSTAVES